MTTTADTSFEGQDKGLEGQPVQPTTTQTTEPTTPKPGVVEPHDNGYPHTQLKEQPPSN